MTTELARDKETQLMKRESQLVISKKCQPQYLCSLCPKTINDVFVSKEPEIADIVNINGLIVARAAICYLISETLEFFSVKESMSDVQIAVTADLIIEEYPSFKTDDLKLCFKNAKKLRYGEVYNRIDGSVIMRWLKEYNKERCAEADEQSYNEYKRHLAEQCVETEGIFYADYRRELERKAALGDAQAIKSLKLSNSIQELLKAKRREINNEA